jgi:hypothetical protein
LPTAFFENRWQKFERRRTDSAEKIKDENYFPVSSI